MLLPLVGCLCLVGLFARPAGAEGPADDRDTQNLVLLAPRHPVFIRLHVQVDGASLKRVRWNYAAQMLKQYDANADGSLDKDEAKKIPPLVAKSGMPGLLSIFESWVSVDRNPADDRVTVDEFADWIDRALGSPFSLALAQRSTQSVDLFGRLDINHDGRLTRDELLQAEHTLAKLDLDEDETFTIDELSPTGNPAGVAVAAANEEQANTDQPFLLLSDETSIATAAKQLALRYGESGTTQGLSAQALGLTTDEVKAFDIDGNGRLESPELETLLKQPPIHIELLAALLQKQPGKPQISVLADRLNRAPARSAPATERAMLTASGLAIDVRVRTNRAASSDNRNFYRIKFLEADKDKNKYLNESEFGTLGISDATFAQVDRDGDGMLTQDELIAYIDQDNTASQSRVVMTVSHNGKSVFEALDVTLDRRLTRRELLHAVDQFRRLDRDGDGVISAAELAGEFSVVLEPGKVLVFRNDQTNRPGNASTAPIVNRPASGPDWFMKMDRNRDGDVSRREFLGPPAIFRRLDTDGDGLISVAEAEAAEKGEQTAP